MKIWFEKSSFLNDTFQVYSPPTCIKWEISPSFLFQLPDCPQMTTSLPPWIRHTSIGRTFLQKIRIVSSSHRMTIKKRDRPLLILESRRLLRTVTLISHSARNRDYELHFTTAHRQWKQLQKWPFARLLRSFSFPLVAENRALCILISSRLHSTSCLLILLLQPYSADAPGIQFSMTQEAQIKQNTSASPHFCTSFHCKQQTCMHT